MMPFFLIFWAFTLIFFYCELGKMVTNEFNLFNEELCQCKWYLFSLDMQRMMLIFMSDAQQPMLLRGYGNIECTRDSFKNVIFFVEILYFFSEKKFHLIFILCFLKLDCTCWILVLHDGSTNGWIEIFWIIYILDFCDILNFNSIWWSINKFSYFKIKYFFWSLTFWM